jgi:DNA-binding LacI/PurR family transcriptional regulator
MSVIGFDDDVQVCESLFPALTSIHYPSEVIGRQAVQLLLKRIKEKDSLTEQIQETVLVRSMLIERASCQQRA